MIRKKGHCQLSSSLKHITECKRLAIKKSLRRGARTETVHDEEEKTASRLSGARYCPMQIEDVIERLKKADDEVTLGFWNLRSDVVFWLTSVDDEITL